MLKRDDVYENLFFRKNKTEDHRSKWKVLKEEANIINDHRSGEDKQNFISVSNEGPSEEIDEKGKLVSLEEK